jgi:hypothetical protein
LDVEWKRFETANASKLDRLSERASGPDRPLGDSQVERITQRSGAADIFLGEFGNLAFFLALEMQTVGVNLSEMDFHGEMTKEWPSPSGKEPEGDQRFVIRAFGFVSTFAIRASSFTELGAERRGDLRRKEFRYVATEPGDLFYDPGAEISVFLFRH